MCVSGVGGWKGVCGVCMWVGGWVGAAHVCVMWCWWCGAGGVVLVVRGCRVLLGCGVHVGVLRVCV